ncbi:PREDICTED: differentially expressed in FDCP 8 homolog isoform X2 [Rhagoletis zephyria]|uniref:differentially expressed in FDCP 8 homolog isoform X2 n=1 Tax=Rhagoletis zephyria TaxID=28612 RepID=UPI0008115308|nr:PREDICTED: differentially expressed in FDCP 8 homolog isoform X2 [Rhagoletis zephyria]
MNPIRGSLASIPGALTTFISESASSLLQQNSVNNSATGVHDDDVSSTASQSDRSYPIPASLVKEQWRLIFTSDANAQDLEAAIAHCRDLVMLSDECSEERRWLVRHLVDLRYSLKELESAQADPLELAPHVKTVVGHHFNVQRGGHIGTRQYCDHCSGIIWRMIQACYICSDCNFLAHQKCVDSVVRICAHVVASERRYPIDEICPEIGLAAQRYKCAECGILLNFKNSWIEPRLCDYSGLYYCPNCHWNDSSIIPARVVHNWDFMQHKVSRASLQEISLFHYKPVIKLEEANPKLFVFLEKMGTVKKLRQNLFYMRKYLLKCRTAAEEKLIDKQIIAHLTNDTAGGNDSRRHLIQSTEFFSISDLELIEKGILIDCIQKLFNAFDRHIRNCQICRAKAYICEICGNNEVIFPFDDGCIMCDKCNSIYHRVCMTRKNMVCPKCVRMQERKIQLESKNGDDTSDADETE